MRCCCGSQGQGGDLVVAAAVLSILLAQGKMAEEIELLSALLNMVGENLGLLALKAPSGQDCSPSQEQNQGRRCHAGPQQVMEREVKPDIPG